MSYAKLINNKVEFAPKNKGAILNYNQNKEMLLADGYREFIKAEPEFGHLKYHIEYNITDTQLQEIIIYDETEEEYKAAKEKEEAERIAMLSLTAADVERALYKAFGKDFDDILQVIQELNPEEVDFKALKIELKANNFFRGNPYVNIIGELLGITTEQLDEFFETNDYTKLLINR